jgi:hypothetical protein
MGDKKSKIKLIPLTQGKFATIDEGDFAYLNQWKWHFSRGYARRSINVERFTGGAHHTKTVSMHRQLLGDESSQIDHANHDGLDNRRSNLRPCSRTQNQQNRKVHYNKRFKGVNWHKQIGAWQVSIRVDKKLKHIGYYGDEIYAAKVYNKMALKYFGEFARLNHV